MVTATCLVGNGGVEERARLWRFNVTHFRLIFKSFPPTYSKHHPKLILVLLLLVVCAYKKKSFFFDKEMDWTPAQFINGWFATKNHKFHVYYSARHKQRWSWTPWASDYWKPVASAALSSLRPALWILGYWGSSCGPHSEGGAGERASCISWLGLQSPRSRWRKKRWVQKTFFFIIFVRQ